MHRPLWHKHPHVRTDGCLTVGERAADWLKHWFGTWTALGSVAATITVWITLQFTRLHWDLYPFILLNLCLSCLAAVQGIILQISANRQDRINSEVQLHTLTNGDKLLELNEQQMLILKRLDTIQKQLGTSKYRYYTSSHGGDWPEDP